MATDIEALLGKDAQDLLSYQCKGITADELNLPGPDYIDRVLLASDRPIPVVRNLASVYGHGRLGGTGYLSILPVDQGIEHSAGASFAKNPAYFDPANLIELALEGGSRHRHHPRRARDRGPALRPQDPLHREAEPQRLPPLPQYLRPGLVRFGPPGGRPRRHRGGGHHLLRLRESDRQIQEVRHAFKQAHSLGLFTVLWTYLRNEAFKTKEADYHLSADLTGQANHMGVTIEADIIKQKQPENNGGYTALKFGMTDPLVYEQLTTDNPIDLTRWQVVNCYAGRIGLINSGGASRGRTTWPRPSGPPSSTSGPAGPASSSAQGLPTPDGRRRQLYPRRPGRLPGQDDHHRLKNRDARPSAAPDPPALTLAGDLGELRPPPVAPAAGTMLGPRVASCMDVPLAFVGRSTPRGRPGAPRDGGPLSTATDHPTTELDRVVIRFAGDSGDGMQLTGTQFTSVSALFGNDTATLPDFPAEIRAPAGTLAGVSAFQVHISDHDILTPGDAPPSWWP